MIINHTVLIIAEPNFEKKCKEIGLYKEKLYAYLQKRNSKCNLFFASLTGNYSYIPQPKIEGLISIETDDSNKTLFNKNLFLNLSKFNEAVIISNEENDPYLTAIIGTLSDNNKGLTIFNYELKDE